MKQSPTWREQEIASLRSQSQSNILANEANVAG